MVEALVNGSYVAVVGAEAAQNYLDFPAYWDWIQLKQLMEIDPSVVSSTRSIEEIKEMERKHGAVKHRFAGIRTGDWCRDNIFQRAAKVDSNSSMGANTMKAQINIPWRHASAYVHGTAHSIRKGPFDTDAADGRTMKHRVEDARAVICSANVVMFVLLSRLDLFVGGNRASRISEAFRGPHKPLEPIMKV